MRGLAPNYIVDILKPYDPTRTLRSTGRGLLTPFNANRVTMGDRAFAARAPKLWNALPQNLRDATSVPVFKSLLKTFLFTLAFP